MPQTENSNNICLGPLLREQIVRQRYKGAYVVAACDTLKEAFEGMEPWLPFLELQPTASGKLGLFKSWLLNMKAFDILNTARKLGCEWAKHIDIMGMKPQDKKIG